MTVSTTSNGCSHPDRPVDEVCLMCGKGLCFQCSLADKTDTRVIEKAGFYSTNGGGHGHRTSIKHGIFCAKCFLERISDPNYRLITSISDTGKPNLMKPKKPKRFGGNGMPLWWTCGIYLMMPFFCLSCFLLDDNYSKAKEAYNEYMSKKNKAQRIVQAMGGT